MFKSKIYSRIMDAIKEKIDQAQKDYDDTVKELEDKFEKDILDLEDTIVEKFINKIL